MWSKIPEEEPKAPPELRGPREMCVITAGHARHPPYGLSSHLRGRWIIALSLVLGVAVAAVVMTLVSQASFSTFNSATSLVEAEATKAKAAQDPDQKIEKDVERDVERDVDKDIKKTEGQAEKVLDSVISSDISDPAKKQKLLESVKKDMRRDLDKFVQTDIKKVVDGDVERDVKQDDSPILENYLASPEIATPSLKPEMIEKLAPLWPSMFCWCIMQTVGLNNFGWMEETLIKQQIERGIGIFSCNEWAVMTDETLALNRWGPQGFPKIPKGINSTLDTSSWAIGSTQVAKGAETNPLNAMPFRTAWQALRLSKKLAKHEWVIKVDPDTVWFPVRLRVHLKTYMPGHGNGWDNLFLKNCPRYNSLQGPIEVISRQGATQLENNIQNCGGVWGTGEDHFIVNCLQQLGVPPIMEPGLLNDKYCDGYVDCTNNWKVAFHPHKNPEKFLDCFNQSTEAEHPKR